MRFSAFWLRIGWPVCLQLQSLFFSETSPRNPTPNHHYLISKGLKQKEYMERNSFSNGLKDSSTGNNAIKDNYKLKDSLTSSNNEGYGEDYLGGYSWPPRSYACSFCKREFRSAQALGGHMNVHRRDRARLRQSPPRDHHGQPPFLNFSLNPNPNPTLSSSSLVPSPCSSTFPSLLVSPPLSSLSSPSPSFPCEMKKWRVNGTLIDPLSSKGSDSTNMNKGAKPIFGVKELKDYGCNNKFLKKKKIEYVNLDVDLEMGLVSDSKEDLDLELRLGYS